MLQNLNKKAKSILVVYGIVFLLYIVFFACIPFHKVGASWVAFVFALISLIVSIFITAKAFQGQDALKSKLYGVPVFRVGLLYAAVQLIVTVIICILGVFFRVPVWVALVLGMVLFGCAVIGFIGTDNARDAIQEQEKEVQEAIQQTKMFRLNIESIVDRCGDPGLKKELRSLSEAIRYSDPVSSEATEEIEREIESRLEALATKVENPDEASNLVKELKNLVVERNRVCKVEKR
ncbi:MAG: hypothetical protein IJ744_09515 [Lachnospiraceae bacterium]|nr:hypothetical protein [Lachnospiraceae bacterium]